MIWVPAMLEGGGIYITRAEDNTDSPGYLATVTYKIGYCHTDPFMNKSPSQMPCLVSMSDGWTRFGSHTAIDPTHPEKGNKYVQWESKQDLCDDLNRDGRYRFATGDELVSIIIYSKTRYNIRESFKNTFENIETNQKDNI